MLVNNFVPKLEAGQPECVAGLENVPTLPENQLEAMTVTAESESYLWLYQKQTHGSIVSSFLTGVGVQFVSISNPVRIIYFTYWILQYGQIFPCIFSVKSPGILT